MQYTARNSGNQHPEGEKRQKKVLCSTTSRREYVDPELERLQPEEDIAASKEKVQQKATVQAKERLRYIYIKKKVQLDEDSTARRRKNSTYIQMNTARRKSTVSKRKRYRREYHQNEKEQCKHKDKYSQKARTQQY